MAKGRKEASEIFNPDLFNCIVIKEGNDAMRVWREMGGGQGEKE